MKRRVLRVAGFLALMSAGVLLATAQESGEPPRGPFGFTLVEMARGGRASPDDFYVSQDCALCHPRQWDELRGSMHSVAHDDSLYRMFAELARREAGEEVYTYCSGCHSPAGVVTGQIPVVAEAALPPEAKAGVTCDVCHQISELTGFEGPWGEPGNASFKFSPGRQKYGPHAEIARNPAHTGLQFDELSSSEFCASCHSIIHPINGLRIEHTYEEWKNSVYAENGVQCQDCHMRSVDDAIRVAETLAPVEVRGTLARKGPEREIAPHYFVGGNVDARTLGGDGRHASMAVRRLRSAATLGLEVPETASAGNELALGVVVTNVGAGHNLPTSLTELRQMWVHVRVLDTAGELLYESGALDEEGEILPGAIRFGAELLDSEGHHTFKPWEAAEFAWKRLVPPKGSVEEVLSVPLPESLRGTVRVEAKLLYRIAPPHVVRAVMEEKAFVPQVVEMAAASTRVSVQP